MATPFRPSASTGFGFVARRCGWSVSHLAKSSGPGTASPGVTPPVSGGNTWVMWWNASAELSTGSSGVGSIST